MAQYDVITVGGGLAGSALATALARDGMRVLVLERTEVFQDRVRGEQVHPWGVVELKELGLYDLLLGSCGHELPWLDMFLWPEQIAHRDLRITTPQQAPEFSFYHPATRAGRRGGRGRGTTWCACYRRRTGFEPARPAGSKRERVRIHRSPNRCRVRWATLHRAHMGRFRDASRSSDSVYCGPTFPGYGCSRRGHLPHCYQSTAGSSDRAFSAERWSAACLSHLAECRGNATSG